MQKHRYKLSFFITLAVYIALVAGYIYLNKNRVIIQNPPVKTLELALQTFIPPPQIPPQPDLEDFLEKPQLQEHHISPTPPLIEESITAIEKPVITIKPPVQRKPKKKRKKRAHKKHPKKEKVIKVVKQQSLPESVSTYKSQMPAVTQPVRKATSSLAAKERFLTHLRQKIDKGKSYPHIAKKRRMQGIVQVSFTISKTGTLQNLQIKGPTVFRNSARNAVLGAFPVDTSSVTQHLPLHIRLKLHYQIH